ncbi:MAG: dinitrogenase iron-molybdenum cofactor biosynthesis protein [Candidatus Lokiarchaeota archaeon]|nr:dinitrogenase iron-molybdenum cofactor biosynthesis protein [Candidatus Lokiarchaeota archaeon]
MIAVSSQGNGGLDAPIDPRFGRCASFTFVTIQNGNIAGINVVSNASRMAAGGAGIQSAQTVGNNGANVILTGNVGPNAFNALNSLNIEIYTGLAGMTVKEAVSQYLSGSLQPVSDATVGSHFGMGGGRGRGGGRGGGGRGGGGGGGGRSQF